MGIGRAALLSVFKRVSRIYFRETEVVGEVPLASTGGRVFAANHVNGLVDPILVLTNAPCEIAPLAKSTLWKVPVLRWLLDAADAVPVVRRKDDPNKKSESNDAIFEKVAAHLAAKKNILIFPEGTSHNEPHLVKLKTGGGRMLARAHDAGTRGLTFQAVGLEFDDRESFRSRALVVYGPVRSVDEIDASGDALAVAITERLREDLSELIVEGADWEDRLLIARVASLFAHQAGDASLEAWNEIGRRVEAARKTIGSDGADHGSLYADIKSKVALYFDALDASGIADETIARSDHAHALPPRKAKKRRAALLALTLPLAIPGAVLYWLPYQLPRVISRRVAKEERDVVSTYKLATGLVVFPLWAGALVSASLVFLPMPLSLVGAGVALASPFAALVWLDHLDQRRLGRARAEPTDVARLRAMRAELSSVLDAARQAHEKR
jgi:glycerol-3-phosphate O-acyltransferase/dihydroxyacetone phosphate acyltransferase